MKACSLDACGNPAKARGWCGAHYERWRKFGDPLGATYQPATCSIADCEVTSRTRGWCDNHYRRFMKWGDPTVGPPAPGSLTNEERFLRKVDKSGGCWAWAGHKNAVGYGSFKYKGATALAHRVSWILHVGQIPDGMQIDHICMNKSCVNPSHLRLATAKQNCEHKDVPRNNTSGYRGVSWHKSDKKWRVVVGHNGKNLRIGSFDDLEEANAAAVSARLELFTHNELDKWGRQIEPGNIH